MIHHKYEVLRGHCEALGRPYEEIERSNLQNVRISADGSPGTESPAEVVDRFGELGDAGAQQIIFSVRDVWQTEMIELLGKAVIPQLRDA
jgi:alkanesulfonate monooxygenase